MSRSLANPGLDFTIWRRFETSQNEAGLVRLLAGLLVGGLDWLALLREAWRGLLGMLGLLACFLALPACLPLTHCLLDLLPDWLSCMLG